MTLEDRVRSATRYTAGAVHSVRPLVLPEGEQPRARYWNRQRRWMAPVTAAAAVIAIAATLVIVKDARNGQPAPSSHGGIPQYYVALHGAKQKGGPDLVVVGDTFTGTRLATVSPPAHSGFIGVTGTADDRTFVLDTQAWPFASDWPVQPRTWYLLRLAPGTDHPARLTRLPIPATPSGLLVAGMALSPDGGKFAVALEPNTTETLGPETLRIYSVATGALLRTWTGPTSDLLYIDPMRADNNHGLYWLADGHTLVFDYGTGARDRVRVLDTSRPGHSLLGDSRPAGWSVRWDACSRPVVTSDGKSVICFGRDSGAFRQYSMTTGQLTRTLYRLGRGTGDVLWASSSGDVLIGSVNTTGDVIDPRPSAVGVIIDGKFRKLSFPLVTGVPIPDAVAW